MDARAAPTVRVSRKISAVSIVSSRNKTPTVDLPTVSLYALDIGIAGCKFQITPHRKNIITDDIAGISYVKLCFQKLLQQ